MAIQNEIGTVFIPVKDLNNAKKWYSDLLDVAETDDIIAGHLYILPMKGTGIVLDSKIYSEETVFKKPAFHLNAKDIEEAYHYVKEKGMTVTSEIENGHWFTIQDCDGNELMICKC